ncbi:MULTISPECIES: hypothetical protein [Shewanella]|uniref:Intracellular growth attenuator family protein n=1 Tax=Shewanella marisflavi TaxID=260364 RepID=A0AAC9U1T3_9GAMM|nr:MULTISPECIES: hypothetical protein [Shewanella]ASJ98036.1 hypothetical protein CFF01_16355 [Shewanella marisflavi]MCL1040142.1 intracellular growth attenuator family protein [Shewanella marisflavi]QDF76608.1 intracellular growth attenuator family protein [Shewanella marisflavi]
MIGFGRASSSAGADVAVNIITYLGAGCLLVVVVGFTIALYKEWLVVRRFDAEKQRQKFYDSLSNITTRSR